MPDEANETNDIDVAASVLAAGTSAAIALGAGPAAPVFTLGAAMATPVLEKMYARVLHRFSALVKYAATDGDVEALEERLIGAPHAAQLVLIVAEATAHTCYPRKVRALGEALRAGVLYEDGTKFDVEAHIISVMAKTERLHVLVLAHLEESDGETSMRALSNALPEVSISLTGISQELILFGLLSDGLSESAEGLYAADTLRLTRLGREVIRRFRVAGEDEESPPPWP